MQSVIHPDQHLLAFLGVGDEAASVLACRGEGAALALHLCMQSRDRSLSIPAPQGAGLHSWDGVVTVLAEGGVDMDGEWRRASADDLEAFGFPLSESVQAEPARTDGFCCDMRKKFLPGIIAEDPKVPVPLELADYVLRWGKPIVFALKHCPFCGRQMDHKQVLRSLEGG